jgi:hypothetical protein
MIWCSGRLPKSQLKVDAGWRQVTSWANGVDREWEITSLCAGFSIKITNPFASFASFSPKERRRRVNEGLDGS